MAYGIGVPQQQASPSTKPSHSSTVSRRTVLVAGALLPLSACAVLDEAAADTPSPPDPDLQLRALVADAERDLIARYQATADSHPELADPLAEFITRHEQHLAAVLDTAPDDSPASDSPADDSAAGSGPAGDSTAGDDPAPARPGGNDDTSGEVEVPADAAEAVAALRTAERDASAERRQDCVAAADYELAQVVASVAACETAHDRLLSGVG
jgi:hypothetical protein